MEKILIIEDESSVASVIKRGLEEQNYDTIVANNGQGGLKMLEAYGNSISLIILDIIMPDTCGFQVCKHIRTKNYKQLPILILTALGTTDQVVKGLDAGADDYLVKPFKLKELLARVRALLRRENRNAMVVNNVLKIADLELDLDTKSVSRSGQVIKLTSTEFKLLEFLMKSPQKVHTRRDLLKNVWNIHFDMGTNVVDVYVNYLRNKVDRNFDKKLIQTVIGMGYLMEE